MGFFTPWFLAGAVAVGLPIWLHLLKRHKTDPKLFPSLMFFEYRETSSVKHRRLDHILLFVLRTLMILLLALLFASPFIRRSAAASDGKKLTVVAIDRSFSMRDGDRLARAKDQAQQVLANLKPGDQAQVIALAGQVQSLTQVVNDPGALRAAVAAVQPSDSRASYGELARYLRTLSEGQKLPLEVHLVSDMQKSAMPPGFADLRLAPSTTLVFHPVGAPEKNWTVENVVAPRRVFDPKRVKIQATVTGFGTPAAKRSVTLLLNGRELQSKTVDVPENGRAQVEFLGLEAPYGFSKGEVRIDAADSLPGDDHYYFSTERTDPRKVLFIDDGRRPRAELYFRTALDSSGDGGFQMDTQRPEAAAAANLSSFAFVVLNDPASVPQNLESALEHYVNAGGSVLVTLGPGSAVLPRVPVLDEAIQASSYAGREGDLFLTVTDIDSGHPALRSVDRFNGVKFYQAIHAGATKSRVLAKLNDGTPLVLERNIGEGKVLAFASTFDNVLNDLPIHASWVPFVAQTALYLGGGGAEQPVNIPVDSYVELRAGDAKGAAAEVLDPDGKRVLSLEEAVKARNFALDREGFYEIKTAAGRRSLVAAHADRRESDLATIPLETLDLWKGTGSSDSAPSGGAPGATDAADKPWGLWPYILLLLLGVAVAESVVANGFLRSSAPQRDEMKREAA
ncbi:MAG: BatA and WFA domain-containing protein [Acidobacteriota bacterium]|nr:BatA and WFA domain-containing protein [Acidobacteriota bacterium]